MRCVSLVMAYYNNPQMLQMQYQWLRDLPEGLKSRFEYVVVDDGSRRAPAVPPETPLGLPFQLYRIGVDVRWNQDAARNIGVEHASNEWVLLTDMDHLVPDGTLRAVMAQELDDESAYRFTRREYPTGEPYKFHPNSWFMKRELYQRMGGFDERFAGWYGTDSDFRDRVVKWSKSVVQLKEPLLRIPREVMPDASTPKDYGRKSQMDGAAINRIKADRLAEKDPRPKRLTFPYVRVA